MDSFTPPLEQDSRKLEDARDSSGLKFYSMALVVRTPKSFPSTIIEVTPIESLSIQNSGKVEQKDVVYKQTHQDASGAFDSKKDITKNNTIEAEWLPLSDSNRATPPCVYQDESVILYKYADVQKYYWTTIKHQPELRKKEMVRWSASNETTPLKPYTKETSFFIEFNALTKKLEIGTPVSGEGVAYRILMDVGNGQLDIADNVGNSMILKSGEGTLTVSVTKDLVVNAGGKVDINAPTTNVNSPIINLNGDVTISKGLKIANGISVAGGGGGKAATIGGDLHVKGSMQAQTVNSSSVTTSAISTAGYAAGDVSAQAAQNQSAKSATSAPSPSKGSTPTSSPASGSAVSEHPSPQTDKTCKVDYVATANAAGADLTGNKVLDAPKLASGEIPKSFSKSIPGIDSVKEAASKIGSVGQQLASSAEGLTSNFNGGLQGLVSTAQSVQSSVSSTISGVTSSVSSAVSQVRVTAMDPINGLTRDISSTIGSITSPINGITGDISNQVNGFLQPVNSLGTMLTGKALVNNPLAKLTSKVSSLTGRIDGINGLVSGKLNKVTNSISTLTNTVEGTVSKANYAAANFAAPLNTAINAAQGIQNKVGFAERQVSDLTSKASAVYTKTTSAAASASKQLSDLANKSSSDVSGPADTTSTLVPSSKALDNLV